MERSRKLTLTDWTKANDALNVYFEGNKSKLTKHLDMSRTTVTNFFNKKPIREGEFRKICLALRLNWQEASEVEVIAIQKTIEATNEEDWVEEVRSRCRQKMISQYNSIRLLNQTEIKVDQLYVDVWLLKRPTQTLQPGSKMWKLLDLRNDRLGMGDRIRRDEGMTVANQDNRLLILGKPGAGKTTFLKHLAVDCSKERFQSDLIPVLMELREIRSTEWKLLDAIAEQLELPLQQTEKLLKQGQLLILMDGLDEVPSNAFRGNVQRQVRDLAQKPEHAGNRFILTCRTQIITGEMLRHFTAVEVADFTPKQVQRFVENWFFASGLTETETEQKWQTFAEAINQNPALKELTVTPVLLSLMCWVFEDTGELPTQAASLYDQGIDLLLERWNERKEIPEWEMGNEVYRTLTLDQKKQLLTDIAAWKFEHPENFVLFDQKVLTRQIVKLLKLDKPRDGEAVLRAIEAHHGLLVERANRLWSFSHLTFQEYFVARRMVNGSNYEPLLENIGHERWREVCLLTMNMLPKAERLLILMKQKIDSLGSSSKVIQCCLNVVYGKFSNVELLLLLREFQDCDYAEAALWLPVVRALCFDCMIEYVYNIHLAFSIDGSKDVNSFHDLFRVSQGFEFYKSFELAMALESSIGEAFVNQLEELASFELACRLNELLHPVKDPMKHISLNTLGKDAYQLGQELNSWWDLNGNRWNKKFREFMREHKSHLQDLVFNQQELIELKHYYHANKLLVDCLKIDRSIDLNVRQEIEDNLLLPVAELKRRLPKGESQEA